jgi:gluconokinase
MTRSAGPEAPAEKTVLVVMGVAGSGKSTVARVLADALGWPYAEADDFHPDANVAKMSAGIPLTDEDRWPWLEHIRQWIDATPGNAVITCSALRRSYRDVLRQAHARVRVVYLAGTPQQLSARIGARTDHFMPASMLASQLAALEPPAPDEDAVEVGIDPTPAEIADRALSALGLD